MFVHSLVPTVKWCKAKLGYAEMNVEYAINQRPLTYFGSDPKNPQLITPSHLALERGLRSA